MFRFMVLLLAICFSAGVASAITIPNGTLNVIGYDGYNYAISSGTLDAQNSGPVHLTGTVTALSLAGTNTAWFTVGLIIKSQMDRALITYGVPSYMFNNSAGMMCWQYGVGNNAALVFDYAGDFPGGQGTPHQNLSVPFTFDVKIIPNGGGAGGIAYLSINGGPYDAGQVYGTDNWNLYGWSNPPEDYSISYLIAQGYSWDGSGVTSTISFTNVLAELSPTSVEPASWGKIKSFYK